MLHGLPRPTFHVGGRYDDVDIVSPPPRKKEIPRAEEEKEEKVIVFQEEGDDDEGRRTSNDDLVSSAVRHSEEEVRQNASGDEDGGEGGGGWFSSVFSRAKLKKVDTDAGDERGVANENALASDAANERALVVGLLKGRVVWYRDGEHSGRLQDLRDLWFYTTQQHVLLSICLAHPLNPFRPQDRLYHLLVTVFFAFFMAAIVEVQPESEKLGVIVLSNILLIVLDLFMRTIVTCECVQPGGVCECCTSRWLCGKDCVEDAQQNGRALLFALLVMTFVLFLSGFIIVGTSPGVDGDEFLDWLVTWLLMKVVVWGSGFIICLVLFLYYRRTQRPYWEQDDAGNLQKNASQGYPEIGLPTRDFLVASWRFVPASEEGIQLTPMGSEGPRTPDADGNTNPLHRPSTRRRPDTGTVSITGAIDDEGRGGNPGSGERSGSGPSWPWRGSMGQKAGAGPSPSGPRFTSTV